MAKLTLATCQFHIDKCVEPNRRAVIRQMKRAKAVGAHLAHFSETCLNGCLCSELKAAREVDWQATRDAMCEIRATAAALRLWVVVGCNHPLTGKHKPHNSLYVIDDRGQIVNRYDKMFCCGDHERMEGQP